MLPALVLILLLLAFYALFISINGFVKHWKDETPIHWNQWNEPNPIDIYSGMFGVYKSIIFGKACEDAGSKLLLKKRNDIRFILIIIALLIIAGGSLHLFNVQTKPRWIVWCINHGPCNKI